MDKITKIAIMLIVISFILGVISVYKTTENAPKVIIAEAADVETPEPKLKSLGTYKLTAYCACSKCCGKSDGITATGTRATANRTIAVDPKVIPLGSTVVINGRVYTAEDVGGLIKNNRIDIFFNTHTEAINFGVQYAEVFVEV